MPEVVPLSTRAATEVVAAEMAKDAPVTPRDIVAAGQRAGILLDPAHVEAVHAAGVEQGRAQTAAQLEAARGELAAARHELAEIAGAHRRVQAVRRLCEGRRGDDLLLVSAVAVAAEAGTTALDGLPMTLAWTGEASVPDAHDAHKTVIVDCLSSYGGRAALTLRGEERTRLATLLDSEVIRDIHAPCPHETACGSEADLDPGGLFGWMRLDVAGIDGGPRWYCSPGCINAAMLRAQDDLVLLDQAAGDLLAAGTVPTAIDPGVARCARCGCTDAAACVGGCYWVPNAQMIELCSSCATPKELAATQWKTASTPGAAAGLDEGYGPGASGDVEARQADAPERGDAGEDGAW